MTILVLSQMMNLKLFQTERVCRRQLKVSRKGQKVLKYDRKHCWEKKKLLVTSNFSFSLSVFKGFVLKIRKIKGLFGKWLTLNPLPDDNILDWSKLKLIGDDSLKCI